MEDDEVKSYHAETIPTDINVSYDRFCNHSCPSCRKSVFIPDKEYKEKIGQRESVHAEWVTVFPHRL